MTVTEVQSPLRVLILALSAKDLKCGQRRQTNGCKMSARGMFRSSSNVRGSVVQSFTRSYVVGSTRTIRIEVVLQR